MNYLTNLTWQELLDAYKSESKRLNTADRAKALKAIKAEMDYRLSVLSSEGKQVAKDKVSTDVLLNNGYELVHMAGGDYYEKIVGDTTIRIAIWQGSIEVTIWNGSKSKDTKFSDMKKALQWIKLNTDDTITESSSNCNNGNCQGLNHKQIYNANNCAEWICTGNGADATDEDIIDFAESYGAVLEGAQKDAYIKYVHRVVNEYNKKANGSDFWDWFDSSNLSDIGAMDESFKSSTNVDLLNQLDNNEINYSYAQLDGEDFIILDGWDDAEKANELLGGEPGDTSVLDKTINWGFSDEYADCDKCGNVIHLDDYNNPGQYFADTEFAEMYCADCVKNNSEIAQNYIESLINNPERINQILDLTKYGFRKINKESYENGAYGQSDSPEDILDTALSKNPDGEFIFSIIFSSPFAVGFDLYGRTNAQMEYEYVKENASRIKSIKEFCER